MFDEPLSVAQFNQMINAQMQSLGAFSVVGEITEKRITANSGLMMTLKDEKENSILYLSGFAPRVKGVNSVDVGMKVVVSGVGQLYGPFGKFSLQIFSVTPHGEGSLKEAYERLKALLEGKGYFAPERKRKLPEFVTKISLITADDSAAYIDFVKILRENTCGLDIDFYPVHVQGKYAVDEICEALGACGEGEPDCVVLTRGGGSLEDLIAFNDEQVAEAVFASGVPVISAVGHERDTSISDLVADIVASTPSQAAYYLAGHNNAFVQGFYDRVLTLEQSLYRMMSVLDYMEKMLRIEHKVIFHINQCDYSDKIEIMENRIGMEMEMIKRDIENLRYVDQKIDNEIDKLYTRIENEKSLLDSFNPFHVLKRGYAIMRDEVKVIKSIKDLKIGSKVRVQLSDGKVTGNITEIN